MYVKKQINLLQIIFWQQNLTDFSKVKYYFKMITSYYKLIKWYVFWIQVVSEPVQNVVVTYIFKENK